MDKLLKLLSLFLVLGFASCEMDTSSQNGQTTTPTTTPTETPERNGQTNQAEQPAETKPLTKPECEIKGSVMEDNLFWAKNENVVVAIVADEETEDPEMGESHRVLEVYDGTNCENVYRQILPVNQSPDFPYYLSDITYNNVSQVIAIKGFNNIYIFDIAKRELSKPLDPSYLNERFVEDAQTGMIQYLELWENYLIGYAASEGCFVFDLSDPMNGQPILASAEVSGSSMPYNSLFFLESKGSGHQAILPSFDMNTGEFKVNALFEKPINVTTNINKSFRNNQYLVIKELLGGNKSRPIGINMKTMQKMDIPADVASKKVTDIIDWMKNN